MTEANSQQLPKRSAAAAVTESPVADYIGFPALQAWATGAVCYLILVWIVSLVTQKSQARELLGYPRIDEEPAASPPAAI